MSPADTLYELHDLDGIIKTFMMTGQELTEYAQRCFNEVGIKRPILTSNEAVEILRKEFNYEIKEIF